MLKVGKLYHCEQCHLMLYPDQETALFLTEPMSSTEYAARSRARRDYNYVECGVPILVLGRDGKFYEVLAGDRKGWIIYEDFLNIKEIDNV